MTFTNFYVLENVLNHGDFALISAEKSNLPSETNIRRTLSLRDVLSRPFGGPRFTATKGRYSQHNERGFMVLNFEDAAIKALAKRFWQDAIIIGHGGYVVEYHFDGTPDIVMQGWELVGPDATDNFTEIQLTSGKFVRFHLRYPK